MNLITFTYKITKSDNWNVVECLDWNGILSQGKTINECKKNMVEVTELFFEMLHNGELDKSQYPEVKKHYRTKNKFQLTFDYDSGKFIPEKMNL